MKYEIYRAKTIQFLRKVANHAVLRKLTATVRKFPRRSALAGALTLLLVISLGIFVGRAHADSQGPLSPVSGTNVTTSGTAWTNPGNIISSNSSYATVTLASAANSQYLEASNFGFTVPTGATINGVVVEVQKFATTGSKNTMQDNLVSLLVGSTTPTGSNLKTATTWPTTSTYVSYGGTTNMWGLSLTPAQVNASTFGAAIQAINVHSSGSSSSLTASVDHIRVTVYYTPPPISYNQSAYRWFNNKDTTQSLTFTTGTNTTGTTPKSLAAADLDGGNGTDLATANSGSNSMSVFLNTGSGSFGGKSDYTTGSDPEGIAAGDFNWDGQPDLAVANLNDDTVSVFLNNRGGNYVAQAVFPTGDAPDSIVSADFNGDGYSDLATANSLGGNISVLMSNGDGTFATNVNYAADSSPHGITTADFNGDGKPDLAVANYNSDTVSVFLNNGNGTFAAEAVYSTASGPGGAGSSDVTATDFNGDGYADLAVANTTVNTVSVFLNNGNGTFATKVDYSTGASSAPSAVTNGDFNGDGTVDLAASDAGTTKVSIFLGNGDGTFATKIDVASGASSPLDLVAADFNGDGKDDITTVGGSTTMAVLTNTSTLPPIDVDTALAAQDTAATAPSEGTKFRLRLDQHVTGAQLAANASAFKLQYAKKGAGTCSAPTGGYSDVSDTSDGIRYADNPNATNGLSLTTNAGDPLYNGELTNVNQSYQETGTTTFTNPTAISAGQDGMWDFALMAYHAIGGDHYCFKVVTDTGADLNTYTVYPELIIPPATFSQASYRWYNLAPNGSALTFANSYSGNAEGSWANDIIKTSDGGYATVGAAGYDNVNNSYDLGVTKYDSSGAVSWFTTWGGPTPDVDYGTAIIQTSDGGYAVTGKTALGTGGDMFLAKFNSSGTFSWVQLWGNTSAEIGTGLIQTSDGGYIVTGQTNSYGSGDIFLAKFNGSGSPLWNKTWGDTGSDIANAIISTSDGGYALTGGYRLGGGFATSNAFVQKYDSSDNLQWTQRLALSGSSTGNALVQTANGGYAVTGNYAAGADTNSMFLATLNSDGTAGSISVGWGGSASDIGMSLVQTSDGGFAVAGYTNSYGLGGNDMFLAKYGSSGTLSWSKTFGQSGSDEGTAVLQTSDGGYAVTGGLNWQASNGSVLIAKYDSSGTMTGCAATLCQSPSAAQPSFAPTPGFVTVTPTAQTVSSTGSSNQSEGRQTGASVTTLVASAAPVGNPFAPQNTPLDLPSLTPVNLRIDLRVNDSGINLNALNFHLQYALSTSGCSTATYADITSSTPVQYYDDSRYSSGQAISDSPNDPSDGNRPIVPQSYQETNTFTNNISALYAGQDGMWQFSLAVDGATLKGRDYCIRVTTDSGTLAATYTPEVAYGPIMTGLMRGGNWFSRAGVKQNLTL